ncbi:uncharacterized protein [Procambarus clarkii]|uniref:uncharacterized protein isoform X2 n=1 Tax=Procambarus clarkii TaxID=6728 RepID=UPI003742540C
MPSSGQELEFVFIKRVLWPTELSLPSHLLSTSKNISVVCKGSLYTLRSNLDTTVCAWYSIACDTGEYTPNYPRLNHVCFSEYSTSFWLGALNTAFHDVSEKGSVPDNMALIILGCDFNLLKCLV